MAYIPNMIKFYEAEWNKVLRFELPMYFIPSIATSMGSNGRAPSESIQITNEEKEKYFLYDPIKSIESYINICSNHDLLLAKEGYLSGTILNEKEIIKCKEAIANKEKSKKNGKMEIQKLHQERD